LITPNAITVLAVAFVLPETCLRKRAEPIAATAASGVLSIAWNILWYFVRQIQPGRLVCVARSRATLLVGKSGGTHVSTVDRTRGAAITTCLVCPAAQAQERDLKFVLDFISLGRHAPWYVALGKGYFKDEGLNVTIMPSKGTADAIRTVATGGAEIGFIDIPSLVASGSAGATVKIVAANYQKPPYCIFTLNPGANVTEPKQMAGLELGSSTASFVPKIWAAFMEMNKVDSKTLKIVNIDAASRVPMLAAGKVQSIDQFLMSEPAIRRAVTNAKPVCLFAGDYGLEIYANSIGVSEDVLTKNPEIVKKFVRAALKGWKDALADPEEAARIEIQYVKALDPQIVIEEIQILKRIAITPDVEKNGFGYISTDRMKNTVDFINKNIEVPGDKLTAEQIYRPGYLPDVAIKP
jgi:NitT/TauT family transport system substrate-binding protein